MHGGKSKVTYSVAFVMAFLATGNEKRQLEDLPGAAFGCVLERFFLSLETKLVTENFVY